MSKSIYLSSSLQELPEYREAVSKALRRLGLHPLNLNGNSNVGDITKADIFVGIIARSYGPVPRGQDRSFIEQEYDEAVRLNKPRMMYLLDPVYDWPAERIEADPNAQSQLSAFCDKVERNDGRRLFTTPDSLAAQVTTDLGKLAAGRRRTPLLIAAVLAVVALAAFVVVADSGVRTPLFVSLGLFTGTPTSTPTITSTPKLTPNYTPPSNYLIQYNILIH